MYERMLGRGRSARSGWLAPPRANTVAAARVGGQLRQAPYAQSGHITGHDFSGLRLHAEQLPGPRRAQASGSVFGISLPTGLRPLDPAKELTLLTPVYGSSIDYAKVFLSDATGLSGRPFTTIAPHGSVIINVGSAAYTTPGSSPSLLIHEMAHVWQSQHHPSREQFMVNSVESQAAATVAGGDPYCYIPGKPFAAYAAEQIAESVENGEPAIIAHMRGVAAGVTDPANVLSLSLPRWEKRGAPGVKC